MHIFINDVATGMPRKQHYFLQVLTQQDISPLNIAIALDNTVVPKAQWGNDIGSGRFATTHYQSGTGRINRLS